MKLLKGQFAKEFTVVDITGKQVKLSEYRGTKIVLSFYRNVNCPFCNRRVHQLMAMNHKFKESGVQMFFFFESSNDKISSSAFHKGINSWPVIGDPAREVYKLYGVEKSTLKYMRTMLQRNPIKAMQETAHLNLPKDKDASTTLIPADFFIDESFKIVMAKYGKHVDDHVDIEDLKRFAGIQSSFANV